ncbi:MAG: SCO family protein [candidate division Zixibacteria bacterium]|nr:SCO family protein [candidate division Zixibacteria bacterium]
MKTTKGWGFLGICLVWVVLLTTGCRSDTEPSPEHQEPPRIRALERFEIGGDFTLADHEGRTFRLANHRGEAFLIFFGYTFCPDACPQTLAKLAEVYALLDLPPERKLTTLYITVDPERDTPSVIKTYLDYFARTPVTGLTGSVAEIDRVVAQYGAMYKKGTSTSAAEYLVTHTTSLFLVDGEGKMRYLFRHGDTPEFIAGVVKQVWE